MQSFHDNKKQHIYARGWYFVDRLMRAHYEELHRQAGRSIPKDTYPRDTKNVRSHSVTNQYRIKTDFHRNISR